VPGSKFILAVADSATVEVNTGNMKGKSITIIDTAIDMYIFFLAALIKQALA
jgi:hypothetical protein